MIPEVKECMFPLLQYMGDKEIHSAEECREYISTAINLLANKAVSFSHFSFRSFPEEQLPQLLMKHGEKASKPALSDEYIDIVNFIF